jgi:hypothetical protein
LALLQGCVLFERQNQAQPLHRHGKEEEHPEGAYYLYHKKKWIPVGLDALEAQRRRNARLDDDEFKRLQGTAPVPSPTVVPTSGKTPVAVAEKYF